MNAHLKRTLPWSLAACLALCSAACTTTHEAPQGGTETGNPPVIDASLISLVVSQDEVHVRGAPGAVTPGAQVEVTSTLTRAVFHGQAASDGSFDIRVDTPVTDTFEVRASLGGQSSSTVRVVRGGASVGQDAGEDGAASLSCMQRDEMARAQMSATAASADAQCERDEDCVVGRAHTLCSDSCFDVPVSSAGEQQLEDARAVIESGLCKDFEADGCSLLALPCVPPPSTTVGCRDRRCQWIDAPSQPAADCASDFDAGPTFAAMPVYWYSRQHRVCLPRLYGGTGGNGNRYQTLEACEAACAPGPDAGECPPNRIETSVCVEAASVGCARMATACALACSATEHCADDAIGNVCRDGMCQAWSPG